MNDARAPSAPAPAPLSAVAVASACAAGLLGVILVCFPLLARPFGRLLEDFGGAIPAVTIAALTWLGPTLGAVVALLLAGGLCSRDANRKLGLLIAAALVALVALAGCYAALQLPFFTLADGIKAD